MASIGFARAAAILTALALFVWCGSAVAEPRYGVGAALDSDGQRVAFDEVITDEAWGGALRRLDLWLYADRQRKLPPSFDEFTAERLYPGGRSFGGFGPLTITIAGCPPTYVTPARDENDPRVDPVSGRTVTIEACESAARPLSVHVQGVLTLAQRYGTLGRAPSGTHLGDPWYPLVVEAGAPAPPLGRHRVRFSAVGKGSRVIATPEGATRETEAVFSIDRATHAPVFVLDGMHVVEEAIGGTTVTYATRREGSSRGDAGRLDPSGPSDPFDPDPAGHTIRGVRRALSFLRRLRMSASAPGPAALASRLTVVQIDERQRVAVALPGMVAVSDRAFLLLPIEEVERFHEAALQRAVFADLIAPHDREVEREQDLSWVLDCDGAMLVDLSFAAEHNRRYSPQDLVGFAGFHPAVDQLLYAPQVAFGPAYFESLDGQDPDRDGAWRARNPFPTGKIVLNKLRDRLGPERFAHAASAHLFDAVPWRTAAEQAYGAPLDDFFDTWIGPRRKVAYGLGPITSVPRAEGGFTHTVEIERRGETFVREPVVVEVIDSRGRKYRATWDAAGPHGSVIVDTDAPLDDVIVDPDHHLTEDPSLENNHPRYDDSLHHPFRPPILNTFAPSFSYAEGRPFVTIDFAMRARYDVRHGYALHLASDSRGIGGSVRYLIGTGPLRDLNSTTEGASFGVSALRSDGFAGSTVPVTQAGAVLSYGWDSRRQIYDPATGGAFAVGTFVGGDRTDDGRNLLAANLSVRGQQLFWPAVEHIVAITAGGTIARCPAVPEALPTLGGRQLLRGYDPNELVGCSTAYVNIEERWSPIRGLYVNAADLAWGRRLEIVPFASAGVLSTQKSPFELRKHVYLDAGIGVRGFYDYAGVQPGVIAVDVGFPVNRPASETCRLRGADGRCRAVWQSFGLYVTLEQTF